MTPHKAKHAIDENFLSSILQHLSVAASAHELLHRFKAAAQALDFGGCSVYSMPPRITERLFPHIIFSSWPDDLIMKLDDGNLTALLPAFVHLQRSTRPYLWHFDDKALLKGTPKSASMMGILRQYGITTGVYFSIHDSQGNRYLVSIAGERELVTLQEMGVFYLIASYTVNRLCEITNAETLATPSLTKRELQCLHWTASGKTSFEISIILKLSENTVNHYIVEVMRKLDCVSRTQAVAKAFRLGLIE